MALDCVLRQGYWALAAWLKRITESRRFWRHQVIDCIEGYLPSVVCAL